MDWLFTLFCGSLSAGGIYFLYKGCKIIYFIKYKSCLFIERPKKLVDRVICDYRGFINGVLSLLNRKPLAYSVVGMDCEMTSDSINGGHPKPALLQLANPDGFCAIFQLRRVQIMEREENIILRHGYYPIRLASAVDILSEVLENPTIWKVGVNVIEDAQYLEETYGLVSKGCLDIRHVAEQLNIHPGGLDDLASRVLGTNKIKLVHKKRPWESPRLPIQQIDYAALDARLGVDIFMKLNEKEICRRYSWIERLFWDEKTYWRHTMTLWEKFIGKRFVFGSEKPIKCNNWIRQLPGGGHLGYDYPQIVFECASSRIYCVVCGAPERDYQKIIKKAIVPVDYNIPDDDDLCVYLHLCVPCFKRSREVDYELREQLTEDLGAPYPDYKDYRLEKAKVIAREILKKGNTTEQLKLKEDYLCDMLGLTKSRLHRQTMETILKMDCWPGSAHGQFVHDYHKFKYSGTEDLKEFWCRGFIMKMHPKYLPRAWKAFCYHQQLMWYIQ